MTSLLPSEQAIESAKVIRALVADDHELVRDGLRFVFHNTEIEIAGEASDETAVLRLVQERPVDVILLDIGWPVGGTSIPRGFESFVPSGLSTRTCPW